MTSKLSLALICVGLLIGCSSPEDRAQDYLAKADEHYAAGNYPAADLEYRNALQLNGRLVGALYGRAKLAERNADWPTVYGLLNEVVVEEPEHLNANLLLGKLHLAARDLESAIEKSELVYRLAPENAEVLALRSTVLYQLGDIETSLAEAQAAIDIEPTLLEAHLVIVLDHVNNERFDEAIKRLDRIIPDHSDNALLYLLKIQSAKSMGDNTIVDEGHRQLLDQFPDNRSYNSGFAGEYISRGDLDTAEQILREYAIRHPEDEQAQFEITRFYRDNRSFDDAVKHLETLIQKYSNNKTYEFALAELYISDNKPDRAEEVYRQLAVRGGGDGLRAANRIVLLALADGREAEARELIQDILNQEPRNSEALISRARLFAQDGLYDEAKVDLRSVLLDEPNSPIAHSLLAQVNIQQNRPEMARDYYQKAVRHASTPTIALEYATFLIRRQEFDSAESTLQSVLNRNPRNIRAMQLMAQVKLSLRKWEEAQQLANRMRQLDEAASVISDQIDGIALQGRGLFEESVQAFENVQQAVPNDIRPIVTLIRSYIQAGNTEKAKQFLETTIRTGSNVTTAHLLLAQVHLTDGNKQAAEQALVSARTSDPESALPYRALADFYRRDGKLANAESVLRDGLKVAPDDLALGMTLALLMQGAGRDDEAISIYEDMLAINENADVVINNLAALLTLKGDQSSLDRAHDLASRFRDSTVPHFQDTLGWIYHLQGRVVEAQPLLRSAADLLPNAPDVVYHLGKNYFLQGDTTKAAQQLRKAISLEQPFPGIEDARRTLAELDGSS